GWSPGYGTPAGRQGTIEGCLSQEHPLHFLSQLPCVRPLGAFPWGDRPPSPRSTVGGGGALLSDFCSLGVDSLNSKSIRKLDLCGWHGSARALLELRKSHDGGTGAYRC